MAILSANPTMLTLIPEGGAWLWVLLAVVMLFGGKKIPELAKGIGKGIREFNDAKDGIKKEIESGITEQKSSNPTTVSNTTNQPQSNA